MQNYLRRPQANISAGTDCLRFLRVTGGNLPASAVFIVRVRADFFKPRDVSFYPVPNTLTKVTICCFEINGEPFKFDFVPKTLKCSLLALQTVIQKTQLAEKVFTTIKMIGNWLLSLKSKEETTLKWILSGYIKKSQSHLNLKIGEVKAQVLVYFLAIWFCNVDW